MISIRHEFNQRAQQNGETIEEFSTALRNLVPNCQYQSLEDERLRDRFICRLTSRKSKEKLLVLDEPTFNNAMYIVVLSERTRAEADRIELKEKPGQEEIINAVNNRNARKYHKRGRTHLNFGECSAKTMKCHKYGKMDI